MQQTEIQRPKKVVKKRLQRSVSSATSCSNSEISFAFSTEDFNMSESEDDCVPLAMYVNKTYINAGPDIPQEISPHSKHSNIDEGKQISPALKNNELLATELVRDNAFFF